MSDISKLDKNFAVEKSFGRSDIDFYNVLEEPISLYGVIHEDGQFRRLPKAVAESVSEGVAQLSRHTSGGRACFRTDSDFIAIDAKMTGIYIMPHMAYLGSSGFDVYIREDGKQRFYGAFMPDITKNPSLQRIINLPSRKMREIIINFPLYCGVAALSVGILQGARMEKWGGYSHTLPIVFYGSSITQGACANAPGTCYASLLSRRFDCDYINLGFSGNGKGEPSIFEYIAGLKMGIFVYDYDYNAPTPEHLRNTHYAGYRTVRDKNPYLPIIMASRPNYVKDIGESEIRRGIIAETYQRALAEGDKNVFFIDGKEEFSQIYEDGCTVDGCHPTDHGFRIMADAFGKVIEKIL
ncbi:MAG: SGNH/GDSL hydrolase family protein [Eubacteriales bacterium]